jgi:hypothetical protein
MLEGAHLIRRIMHGRLGAFKFDGVFIKPGKLISEESLWPGPDWPRIPHLIEIFQSAESHAGHGGSRIDVILWVYESAGWRAICRLDGCDSNWMKHVEPILARSLEQSRIDVETSNFAAIAAELLTPVADHLATLEKREDREAFATELYTRLMMIVCAEQE